MKWIGVVVAAAFIVSVRASAAVTGFVWQDDGTPAAHVRVSAYRPESWRDRYLRLASKTPARVAVATATTDEKGAYTLDTPGRAEVAIEIDDPSFAPVLLPAIPGEPLPSILVTRVPLRRGTVTSGGKPVAGASLLWRGAQGSYETRTDASGSYSIPDPERWSGSQVEVIHPDFAYAMLPAAAGLHIQLERGVTIRGKVVDAAGKAVAGATITVDSRPSGVTGEDGSFTLTHVPPLYQRIVARHAKDAGAAARSNGDVTITLAPAASLVITVRDEARHPLPGMLVSVSENENGMQWATTDQKGVATIDGLSRTDAGVVPGLDGAFTFDGVPVTLRPPATARQEIVAKRFPIIKGVVRDEKGEPVAGAAIVAAADPGRTIPADMLAMTDLAVAPLTASNGDGTFIARAPLVDSLRLGAVRRGFAPSPMKTVSLKETSPNVEVTLPKGLAVRGIVTADGKPFAGARIIRGLPFASGQRTRLAWAVTGADGAFSGHLNAGDVTLIADADGFLPEPKTFAVSDSTPPVTIALEHEATIAGRVTNADGSPASGVFVWLEDQGAAEISAAAADDAGRFTLKARKGTAVVGFGTRQRRAGAKTVNAPATDVTLVMPQTALVRGRVIDQAGAPVNNFSVTITQAPSASDSGFAGGVGYPFTSPNGEFELDDAPTGAVKISVTADGFISAEKQVAADEAQLPVSITLVHGRTIRGRVSTPEHQPVKEAMVSNGDSRMAPTSEDGTYELTGIPREAVEVSVNQTGFMTVKRSVPAGDGDVVLDVELSRGRGVSGKVVDANGKPVPNANVSASSAAHDAEYQYARSGDDGTFRIDGLAPARYDFDASTDDNQRGEVKDIDVERVKNVVITLKPRSMATIVGSVAAIPPSALMTRVEATSDDGYAFGSVDSSGNYRIENAPAGAVSVSARTVNREGRNRRTRSSTLDVAAGATKRVDLTFAGGSTIRGRVTRGSEPLPGAAVVFSGSDQMEIRVVTGADGTYEAEGLPEGTYSVSVRAAAPVTSFSTTRVVSGSATFDIDINIDRVAVHVVDAATSLPIAEAAVSSAADGSHSNEQGITDRAGLLQFDLTRGSANHLVISKKGYATALADLPKSSSPAEVSLVRSEGAIVRLVDARDGRTLKGNVVARDDAGRVVANNGGETSADGTVTMPVVPGSYRFSASASSYGSQTVRATVPAGEVRIALPRGGKLIVLSKNDVHGKARLIQPDGEEYVLCWCSGIADIVIKGRRTEIDAIAPGSYLLEVALDGAKPQRIPVSVIEGESMTVEMPW